MRSTSNAIHIESKKIQTVTPMNSPSSPIGLTSIGVRYSIDSPDTSFVIGDSDSMDVVYGSKPNQDTHIGITHPGFLQTSSEPCITRSSAPYTFLDRFGAAPVVKIHNHPTPSVSTPMESFSQFELFNPSMGMNQGVDHLPSLDIDNGGVNGIS